jgi:hypothetical protein
MSKLQATCLLLGALRIEMIQHVFCVRCLIAGFVINDHA